MTTPETPAAPPAASYTPVVTDLTRLGRVLFSPAAVFEELREAPTFWMPWLVVSILYAAIQFFQRPFQARVREIMMEQAGRPAPPASAASGIIGMALTPVTVLVLCVIAGAILYGLMAAVGGDTTYKKMLTVVIFAWPLTLLQQALTAVVLSMRGVASISSPMDMFVSFGADLLLPAEASVGNFIRFFLAGIGPLQIWAVAITAVGLMVLGKVGKTQAWIAATVSYVIGLGVGAGVATFGMKMMGGS